MSEKNGSAHFDNLTTKLGQPRRGELIAALEAGTQLPNGTVTPEDLEFLTSIGRSASDPFTTIDMEDDSSTWHDRHHGLQMHLTFYETRLLARGGLGAVYTAKERPTNRQVALKFLRGDLPLTEENQQRLLLEAEITARLEHPGIIPIYGIGKTDYGEPFYVMRFVDGQPLERTINEYYASDLAKEDDSFLTSEFKCLLNYAISICRTLDYAHNRGIIHRDLKPSNVLVGRFGECFVIDWGLALSVKRGEDAKASGEVSLDVDTDWVTRIEEASFAVTGPGTPAYMSPEQACGLPVSHKCDVFGLGAILYKMITGHAPFHGRCIDDVVLNIQEGQFPRPSEINPKVPECLEEICLRAMKEDPLQRYRTAAQFADEIETCLAKLTPIAPNDTAVELHENSVIDVDDGVRSPWKILPERIFGRRK